MNYYIQDFCCVCLSISNEKCSNDSSKYADNLTPYDKIKSVFQEVSTVMDNDNKICLKCSDIIDSIYEFNKTCFKNINILSSYKKVLKENQSKTGCNLFVDLKDSKKSTYENNGKNILTSKEIKTEPPESPFNKDDKLCNIDFVSENQLSGAAEVKGEIDMNYETCNELSETCLLYPQIKMNVEDVDMEKERLIEINETSKDGSLKSSINDIENRFVQLNEEVFVKEEESGESQQDRLLEDDVRAQYERISVNQSSFQKKPFPMDKKESKKSHKCGICGKLLTRQGSLKVHMLIHTGDKPHKCDICGKLFSEPSNLRRHRLIHTGEKPHKCNICEKLFNDKGNLKSHMLTHTGEKPHKCYICDKLFTLNIHLKRHLLKHTNEKPHKCDICEKLFKDPTNLARHKFIHTGEKPYKCDICGNLFSRKGTLKRHMLIHTGSKLH